MLNVLKSDATTARLSLTGKVLAMQGGDDPFVNQAQVEGFIREMREGKVDWQLVQYGGAVHAYTLPAAGNDNSKGSAYNEKADRRSWEAMKQLFGTVNQRAADERAQAWRPWRAYAVLRLWNSLEKT